MIKHGSGGGAHRRPRGSAWRTARQAGSTAHSRAGRGEGARSDNSARCGWVRARVGGGGQRRVAGLTSTRSDRCGLVRMRHGHRSLLCGGCVVGVAVLRALKRAPNGRPSGVLRALAGVVVVLLKAGTRRGRTYWRPAQEGAQSQGSRVRQSGRFPSSPLPYFRHGAASEGGRRGAREGEAAAAAAAAVCSPCGAAAGTSSCRFC